MGNIKKGAEKGKKGSKDTAKRGTKRNATTRPTKKVVKKSKPSPDVKPVKVVKTLEKLDKKPIKPLVKSFTPTAAEAELGSDVEEEVEIKDVDSDIEEDDLDDYEEKAEAEPVADSSEEPKKSSKESREIQRKNQTDRKLQRKSGAEVQQVKSLWEKLRTNKPTPPKAIRDKLCNEIWELSKDVILDLVMKHDASRVVQTLVKHSSKERRNIVVEALVGHYYELATSSYGKYLLIKLLHYGSKESRAIIVNELHGKLGKLMRHREGAHVVEDLFVLYSTNEQRQQMIREFWGSEYAVFKESGKGKSVIDVIDTAEKKALVMKNLFGTINAAIEKGSAGFQILHAVIREYVKILELDLEENDKQIREFIELLTEQFAELVHTQEGSEVASTLIALANAKERKLIIKALKDHTTQLSKNEYGNIVLITLFMTVDDSRLLHRSFSLEMFTPELIPELITDKFSRRPLLYLLKGLDGKYFNPLVKQQLKRYTDLAYSKTTKKDQDVRRSELLTLALPLIYESIISVCSLASDANLLLEVNIATQFITELLLTKSDVEEVQVLRQQLVDLIFQYAVQGDILEDHHLINKVPFIARSLKALIQGNEFKWDELTKKIVKTNEEKIPGVGSEFAVRIADQVLSAKNLSDWTQGQAAFVVVAIFEVLQLQNHKRFKTLRGELNKEELDADKDNKGGLILSALL